MDNTEEFWITARGVTRLDGARGKMQVWRPIFEPEVFRMQMYCIEECSWDILGFFGVPAILRRPRSVLAPPQLFDARVIAPLAPSLRPCWLNHNAACKKLQMFSAYVSKQLTAMWQKCIERARLAQRIMTYVTMQLCNSSLHIHGERRGVLNYC